MTRHSVRLTSFAAMYLLSACHSLTPVDQKIFDQGMDSVETGNWSHAVELLSEVIERNKSYGPAYLGRGRARFELGRHQEALDDLGKALEKGGLVEDQTRQALLYTGRSHVEIGRRQFARARDDGSSEAFRQRRDARTSFVLANTVLDQALEDEPRYYEGLLWRAYCYLRLQNHRRALELLRECEKIKPGHWEHRFFKALTVEDLYELNAESLNLYLEITAAGVRRELVPVYEHLIEVFPKAHRDFQKQILARLQAYARSTENDSPELVKLLEEAEERARAKEQEELRRAGLARAAELTDRGELEAAVRALETLHESDKSKEVWDALRATREKWSLRLEAEAANLASSENREMLQEALVKLQEAQKLTTQVDRLGALQQRINATQLALTRQASSRELQSCFTLFDEGRFEEVFDALSRISVESLAREEKDHYHYLYGVASFKLRRWKAAAASLQSIAQGRSSDVDLLLGLALVRSGDPDRGVPYLAALPEAEKTDNVREVMAEYFLQKEEFDKAMLQLESIVRPQPSHYRLRVKVRESLGMKAFRGGDYEQAIEQLESARSVMEQHLQEKTILVYLYLGHSYYRMRDLARAKEAYTQLSEADLTEVEERRSRDLYVHRARIYLHEKQPEAAYRDLERYVHLGGKISSESLQRQYAWLIATYADYMPLDRIHHWKYVDTTSGKSFRLLVRERVGDEYIVERHEDQTVSTERWSREGVFLLKTLGKDVWRIPINLEASKESFPQTEYERTDGNVTYSYKAEIQSNNETVALPGGKEVRHCIKARLWRKKVEVGQSPSFLVYVLYFAPRIGEVKRDVLLNNEKLSEIVLSGFAYKSETLGN